MDWIHLARDRSSGILFVNMVVDHRFSLTSRVFLISLVTTSFSRAPVLFGAIRIAKKSCLYHKQRTGVAQSVQCVTTD
jgi:hypothetical protein